MGPSGAVVPPPTKWAILQPFLGPMMSWPSGNPSLLRVTGAQWRNLATGLSAFDGDMAALKGAVGQQEIPEGGKIGQALADLDEGVTTLADMAKTIGESVDDFAGGVQDTQDAIRRLMDRISLDGLWDTVTGFLTGEGDDILREIAHDVGEVLENFQNQVKGVVGLLEELTIALGLAADAFQRWIRPILVETFGDDVGNALADSVTLYTDFQVGLTTGLINTVSGVVSMADVDTWKGMAELAQSVAQDPSTLPGVLANMGKEFVAWDKWSGDHPGRAAGEAAFNIGSLFVPGGALSKTGSVAKGLSYTTRLFDEGRLPRLSDVPGLGGGDRLPDLSDVPGAGRGLPEMPEFRPGTVPDSVIGPFAPNGAGTPTSPSAPGGPARSGDSTGTTPPGGRGQGTGSSDGPPVASPEPTTGSPDPGAGAAAGPGRGDGPAPIDSGAPAASSAPSPADAAPAAAPGGSPTPDSASGNGSGATTSDPGTSAAAHAGGDQPGGSSSDHSGGGANEPDASHPQGSAEGLGGSDEPAGPPHEDPPIGHDLGDEPHGDATTEHHDPQDRTDEGNQAPGAVRDYDADGRTIPTDRLVHPEANLLDQGLIDAAASSPDRVSDALSPGAPSTHPEVQQMVSDTYDPLGGLDEDAWNRDYWPTGNRDAHGNPDLVWPDPMAHPQGFDSPEGRTPAVLEPGATFDRFGPGFGQFGSPVGTAFPERALPPHSLDAGYHRYEALRPVPMWEGRIAPAMGQPGGGVQYYFTHSIVDLVNAGYLREVPL
jgi:hypothetical protein